MATTLDERTRAIGGRLVPCLEGMHLCPSCVLRFLGITSAELGARPSADVRGYLARELGEQAVPPEGAPDPATCSVCLGLLELFDDEARVEELVGMLRSKAIGSPTFALEISLPSSFIVRQRSAWLHACEMVGRSSLPPYDNLADPKAVLRARIAPAFEAALSSARDDQSAYKVTVVIDHARAEHEAAVLGRPVAGAKRQRRDDAAPTSMRTILKAQYDVNARARLQSAGLYPPPPLDAREPPSFSVECAHAPVCVGGRYVKLARDMPQTPWWLDGIKRGVTSVQERIEGVLLRAYAGSSGSFHASGREDVDVRMLGAGRPFVLELLEPTDVRAHTAVGSVLRELEEEINRSCDDVQVACARACRAAAPRRARCSHARAAAHTPPRARARAPPQVSELRVVAPSSIGQLVRSDREEEEDYRKAYRCVVWVSRAVTQAELDAALGARTDVVLQQKTPIRVLHRRPLHTRPRTVHSMRAERISAHYLLLDLVTQSGTYVKEFVHGDFGRTLPNVGTLLGCSADILQLDVLDIVDAAAGSGAAAAPSDNAAAAAKKKKKRR